MTWKQTGFSNYIACGLCGVTGLVSTWLTLPGLGLAGHIPSVSMTTPPNLTGSVAGRAYEPPPGTTVPDASTDTSGGRTCGVSHNGLQLTPLAPQQHVGQTLSSQPTFAWFVPVSAPLDGEFQIYEMTEDGFQRVLDVPYEFTSTQGFMTFTLASDLATLQADTDYVWQVLLRCGSRPGDIRTIRAQVEVVDASERSPAGLATEAVEQARQLAKASLWYDALAVVSEVPVNFDAISFRSTLLTELADLEAGSEALVDAESEAMPHSEALRQIADKSDSATANLPPRQTQTNTQDVAGTESF